MSRASSHSPISPVRVEGFSDDTTSGDTLPPPLAEIAAHSTRVASAKKLRSTRGGGAKSQVAKRTGNRKTSGLSNSNASSGEVVIGLFVGLTAEGEPRVTHPLNTSNDPLTARSTVPLDPSQFG